ncbi:prenyltransferase/squalene oxidase repeat-containing protein [Amycolatopsis sp., V23-08]|uniref:Prenyltransferase/squalene oxidase repeat-containing protein n=1 Tax=Amycolatopsis heterodermiae TaxID=3110235 RepID=A0ABU5RBU3_9PSEU|nr:prenyltransferase/squalene oxidase repeat-containing protein [Amycolatopsis sp., V23-08]MEA5363114.1 prenyltransferase/squalene oxidase repeat-containing protein [Amycolatopsis sp., V23-08]
MKLRALAVVLAAAASLAVPATASAATPPSQSAAGWLARQLVGGDHLETVFGGTSFPDTGLTIDGIFAFASAGVADTAAGRATTYVASNLAGYIGDGVDESYAGATAKAALAAEVRGLDPAAFGGTDLPTRLRALLTPSGRFSDHSAFGDFSNAFSQSLALLALDRTPGGAPASAVTFLAGTQCADGGFPLDFGVTPCVSDTDSTAMAAQALQATGRRGKSQQGLTWLAGKQQAGGGISAGTGDPAVAPNTNTTGLAGQAFRAGLRLAAAQKAKTFLTGLQLGCAGIVANRGAIAYDATGYNADTVVRATTQGILGLGGRGLAQLTSAGSSAVEPVLACP